MTSSNEMNWIFTWVSPLLFLRLVVVDGGVVVVYSSGDAGCC